MRLLFKKVPKTFLVALIFTWTALLKPTRGADTWLTINRIQKLYPRLFTLKWKMIFTLLPWKHTKTQMNFFFQKKCYLFQINTHQRLLPKISSLFCLRVLADTITQSHAPGKAAKSSIPGVGIAADNSEVALLGMLLSLKEVETSLLWSFCFLPLPPCSTSAELHIGFPRVGQGLCSPHPAPCSGSTPSSDTAKIVHIHPGKYPPGPQAQPELLPDAANYFTKTRQNDKSMVTLIPLFI